MERQKSPKSFLVVLPGEIIEIPQDSDKSWLTLFYSLPREIAEKWKPAYELPRCPYEVLRTDKYDHKQAHPGGQLGHMDNEGVELLRRPEIHFPCLFTADGAGHPGRILDQAVIPAGVVEDRGELIIDRPNVGLRLLVLYKPGLPFPHMGRSDLVDPQILEKRQDFPLIRYSFVR